MRYYTNFRMVCASMAYRVRNDQGYFPVYPRRLAPAHRTRFSDLAIRKKNLLYPI